MADTPESWLCIGGPITRPKDNKEVAVYIDAAVPEGYCDVQIDNGYTGSSWTKAEISQFGSGDFRKGIGAVLGLLATADIQDLTGLNRFPPLPEA